MQWILMSTRSRYLQIIQTHPDNVWSNKWLLFRFLTIFSNSSSLFLTKSISCTWLSLNYLMLYTCTPVKLSPQYNLGTTTNFQSDYWNLLWSNILLWCLNKHNTFIKEIILFYSFHNQVWSGFRAVNVSVCDCLFIVIFAVKSICTSHNVTVRICLFHSLPSLFHSASFSPSLTFFSHKPTHT